MKHILLFLIFFSWGFSACNTKSKNTKTVDEIFTSYLKENFPKNKFENSSIFLIEPKRYCTSCHKTVSYILDKTATSKNMYIISQSYNSQYDSMFNQILIDFKGNFELLDLGVNSASIIFLKSNKIEYITEINNYSLPKIEKYLKEYNI